MARTKDIMHDIGAKAGNIFDVPLDRLIPDPDNIRLDTPDFRAKLRALANDIRECGFDRSQVLRIRAHDDKPGYWLVESGNRRTLASRLANELGASVISLPAVVAKLGMTSADRLANVVIDGERENYSPAEYAVVIRRFESWGFDKAAIAAKLRKSRQWIDNVMESAEMPATVQKLVIDGVVSDTTARQLVRQEGAAAAERIARVAAETGRKHVTARHLAAPVVATAALPAPIAAITPYAPLPDAGLAGQVAAYDATQDALVTLRQAVRAYLAARAARPTDGDDIRAALAQLAELVGVQLGGVA